MRIERIRRLTAGILCLVLSSGANAQIAQPADPHYNILALRVEFAPDTSRFTTGDGTFAGLEFPLVPKVDPLPHDAAYFRAHLDFLAHYIRTASSGKTTLSTFLIPEVIQLDHPMESYSPVGPDSESDEELSKLARFVEESWIKANQVSIFDPTQLTFGKTAFLLFHAGVGRDIELIGTTLDKTPQDLPSIFIDMERFPGGRKLEFKGIPLDHSMIIPRTETRAGENPITEKPYLLQLSINGLMAASFMNYLGVPDLFNTETGDSVIGPFGLMDPLGIFAYGGLFPPMPSAWTRTVLGWVMPMEIHHSGSYTLTAGQVAKIEVSQAEYFLLENRVRTPDTQGLILKLSTGETQTIPKITDEFNRFNLDAFRGGVVTQVNSYDFALPGRDADDIQYNGGILIWHIDERQFSRKGNNDPAMLAVDIEEADGAQDIGFDESIGSPFDFYFADNPASVLFPSGRTVRLYENRFGPDTNPDSRTNGGGDSFLELEDFSGAGPVMSFSFRKKNSGTEINLGVPVRAEGSLSTVDTHIAVFTGEKLLIPSLESIPARVRPALGAGHIGSMDAENNLFMRYTIMNQRLDRIQRTALPTSLPVEGPVVFYEDAYYVLFSDGDRSEVLRISVENIVDSYHVGSGNAVGLVAADTGVYVFGDSHAGLPGFPATWTYELDDNAGYPALGRDRTGLWGVIPMPDRLLLLQTDGNVHSIVATDYFGENRFAKVAAMADVNQDGILDIVTTAGNMLVAFSQGGSLLAPFPIQMGGTVSSSPVVYQSNDTIIIVVASQDGNIYAYDLGQNGRTVQGFPLSAGYSVEGAPLLYRDSLWVVTRAGVLRSYRMPNIDRLLWSQHHGGGQNTGFVMLASQEVPSNMLLNAEETYNWPNPVRDGSTFFRCMTSEAADVSITIIDGAGFYIDSFSFATSAGVPHEVLWHTDAVSGVYYARVEATSRTGSKDSRLIKLAIIR